MKLYRWTPEEHILVKLTKIHWTLAILDFLQSMIIKKVIFCYTRGLGWTETSLYMKEGSVPKLSMLFSFSNHTNIFRRRTVDCRLYQVRASCPQSQVLRLISTCPRNTFRPLESLCHTDRFRVFSGSSSRFTLYWLEIYSTDKIKGYIKYKHTISIILALQRNILSEIPHKLDSRSVS